MRLTPTAFRVASVAPLAILLAASMLPLEPPNQDSAPQEVLFARIDDAAITPVTADFLINAMNEAAEIGAVCLIIELDTPGGLMQSTREIVKEILSSPVPIVIYVAPSGARAASAGVFITMASHVAAMAPATHIGAAHPVQVGGGGPSPSGDEESSQSGQSPMDEKVLNDATAWVRSLAELRGRNAEWAVSSVTESKSIPSTEALDLNVIDILATDYDDLLAQMDGRLVVIEGDTLELHTAGAPLSEIEMWWGERVLSVVSDPNIAFLLLMLGFYGLLFEFYTPGWGVPGTLGAICLILAFFGLAVLPINYAGLLLIFLAIGMFVAEAFITSFGLLTLGGVVCLIFGGIMLVDTPVPVLQVSLKVLIPVAIGTGIVAFFLVGRAVSSFSLKVQTGTEAMAGEIGFAAGDFEAYEDLYKGTMQVHGELWRALSEEPVNAGAQLQVDRCDGLTLYVSKKKTNPDRRG